MNCAEKPHQESFKVAMPIVARKQGDGSWRAAVELPKVVMAMDWSSQQLVLGAVDETISELHRVHAASSLYLPSPDLSWLRLDCVIRMETDQRGLMHTRASFSWPDVWLECDIPLREEILNAVSEMLNQVRDNLSIR